MTDREKAIVMAYTGICMLTGTKFAIFHKYVEDMMGRPVQTIELGTKFVIDEIKEKSEADFIDLCKEDQEPSVTPQTKMGRWEWLQYDGNPKIGNWHCSECGCIVVEAVDKNKKGGIPLYKYCPQCGCKMQEAKE